MGEWGNGGMGEWGNGGMGEWGNEGPDGSLAQVFEAPMGPRVALTALR
jgi:hypothetical protein